MSDVRTVHTKRTEKPNIPAKLAANMEHAKFMCENCADVDGND